MIILENEGKSIKISLNDTMYVNTNKETKKLYYRLEAPTVICNNKEDAEYIQKQINTFVYKLGCKITNIDENKVIEKEDKNEN